ncbi:MAG: hypothetical protein M1607_03800 [Patescibacteria group bacterium]|nr:hypothetical protein [Patescibacteria group bacterium]
MTDSPDTQENNSQKRITTTRRKLLVATAAATPTLLAAGNLVKAFVQEANKANTPYKAPTKNPPTATPATHTQSERVIATTPTVSANITEKAPMENPLQQVLKLPLESSERQSAEADIVTKAQSLQQIDQALWVVNNMNLRAQLIEKRYQLRSQRKDNLKPLNQAETKWALDHELHPEDIAIAQEAYTKASTIIAKLLTDKSHPFRPDIDLQIQRGRLPQSSQQLLLAQQMMINSGGMATLLSTETGVGKQFQIHKAGESRIVSVALSNIGQTPAIQVNKLYSEEKKQSQYQQMADIFQHTTGLVISSEQIPGSGGQAPGDISGGAVSVQMLPDSILDIEQDVYRATGKYLNWADPVESVALAYIFLAKGWLVGQGARFGYWRGTVIDPKQGDDVAEAMRQDALAKWNQDQQQQKKILDAANSYYAKIIALNISSY